MVHGGQVIAAGVNQTKECCDPTAHAEIMTFRAARKAVGDMRIVYGAGREDVHEMYFEDRNVSTVDYIADAYKDDLVMEGGVLANECAELYFRPWDNVPEDKQANA